MLFSSAIWERNGALKGYSSNHSYYTVALPPNHSQSPENGMLSFRWQSVICSYILGVQDYQTSLSTSESTASPHVDSALKALQLTEALRALLEGQRSEKEQHALRKQVSTDTAHVILKWLKKDEVSTTEGSTEKHPPQNSWHIRKAPRETHAGRYSTVIDTSDSILLVWCGSSLWCWSSTSGGVFPLARWNLVGLQTVLVMRSRASVWSRAAPPFSLPHIFWFPLFIKSTFLIFSSVCSSIPRYPLLLHLNQLFSTFTLIAPFLSPPLPPPPGFYRLLSHTSDKHVLQRVSSPLVPLLEAPQKKVLETELENGPG